jgi:signal transduction histidine kinase
VRTIVFFKLITLFCCFSFAVNAQEDPELTWYESFFKPGKKGASDQKLAAAEHQLRLDKTDGDVRAEIKSLKSLGLLHLTQTEEYDKALSCFIKALRMEDSLNIRDQQVFTHLGIAGVFEAAGDYEKCEEYLQNALDVNSTSKNIPRLVRILNEMGKVHAAQGKLDAAFENYEMVLSYRDVVSDPRVEAKARFQMAHLFTKQKKYPEALTHHKEALAISRSVKDKKSEAQSLNDIAELYRLMGNDEKALANHLIALEIRQSFADKKDLAESYNNIGSLYFDQKKYQRAAANLALGLRAAQESNDQHQIQKSADLLYRSYKTTGDYKKASEYQETLLNITEFIQNDRNERQLIESQNRYTLEKKELQIGKLEANRLLQEEKLATQRKLQNFLFLLIGLGLIIVGLVFYLYITKRRSNKVLQVANAKVQEQNVALQDLNATKDKFFSIISHDLKGPLNSLTSFSGLLINHSESLSKEEIKMLAQDLDKSLKNLFALLENLLEWSRSQTGNIEFKPENFAMDTVLDGNQQLLKAQAQNKNISIVKANKADHMVYAHKNSVNTVVRNLISNAIKFTPPDGTITLDARKNGKEVIISIADNGVGMSKEVLQKLFRIDTKHSTKGTADEKGTGLGLILCKEFIEKNNGRIWVESEIGKGSVFYFSLPSFN